MDCNDGAAGCESGKAEEQEEPPAEGTADGEGTDSSISDSDDEVKEEDEDDDESLEPIEVAGSSARLARKARLEAREVQRLARVAKAASARRGLQDLDGELEVVGSAPGAGTLGSISPPVRARLAARPALPRAAPPRAAPPPRAGTPNGAAPGRRGGAERRRLARVAQKAAARRAQAGSEESRLARVAQKAAARRARLAQGGDPSASPEAGEEEEDDLDVVVESEERRLERLATKVALRRTARMIEQLQEEEEEEEECEKDEEVDDEEEMVATRKKRMVKQKAAEKKQSAKAKKTKVPRKGKRRKAATDHGEDTAGGVAAAPRKKKKRQAQQPAEEASSESSSSSSSSSSSCSTSSSSESASAMAIAKALATGKPVPTQKKKGKEAPAGALFAWESAGAGRPVSLGATAGAAMTGMGMISPLASSQEVEQFLAIGSVDGEAAQRFRMMPANHQRLVMEKGPILGCRNPSSVLIARVRDVETGRITAPPVGFGQTFGGATAGNNPAIEKLIVAHRLDMQAAQALRGQPLEKQQQFLKLSLDGAMNPSALVMTKLVELNSLEGVSAQAPRAAAPTGTAIVPRV